MSEEPKMITKRFILAASLISSLLVSIVFLAVAFSAETPQVSPFSCASPTCQSGSNTCTVAINTAACTTSTITFGSPYTNPPVLSFAKGISYSTAPFRTLSTTDSFQAEGGVNFIQPQNSTQLLFDTETAVSITVPNADTSLKIFAPSYFPSMGSYSIIPQVLVQTDGYISEGALTTPQDISIKIEDSGCGGTVLATTIVHPAGSVISKKPWSLSAIDGVISIFSTNVALCIQAPANDANTSVFMVDMHVNLIQNHFQSWVAMPAAVTELFGNNQHEQTWQFDSAGYSGTLEICVNVVGISGSGTATLQAQFGTTNFGPSISISAIGNICTNGAATIPTGIQFLRIVGANGLGVSDIPAFGSISISWQYTISKTLSFNTFDPGNPSIATETSTTMTLTYTFVATINNIGGVVITFNWQSIGS